ncbi:unnamed protein product [Medioppia subpectinata]|uniref:Methionyl-tRNA formyltransferase n=1 Tax=Medioppia subpectinata TaxID=1979941 RepID=A0A7R9LUI3_9ACAR|nr:unnamed protein product [Medioppia subpectinata]CAG2121157.1 unnamed protein product [Medioppia subpectinata]
MLNIHGSLLPRWRGAAPVNYAVLNADAITGITVMRIKPKKFDVGDIVCQMEYRIPDRITAKELKHRLAPIGAQLLWKCLLDLDNHLNNAKPQPNEGITYAPKFDDTYGLIEWSTMTATDIDRRFRAFDGFIDVYTHWTDGTRVRLHDMVSPEVVSTLELDRLCGRREPSPGFVYYHKKRRIVCVKCAANTWSAFGSLAPKGHKQISAHQFNNGFIKRAVNPLVLGQQMT